MFLHNNIRSFPTLAPGIQIPKHTTPWTFGNETVVIPANTVVDKFSLLGLIVEAYSACGVYEIALYCNGGEIFRGRFSTGVAAGTYAPLAELPLITDLFEANSQIAAKIASNNAGPGSVTISLKYFTH